MNFKDRYKYNPQTDLLGKGGFARVYKATDTLLERDVAIKVFNTTDNNRYTVLEEIKKVIKYEHTNLLRYYDVAILENTNAFGESEVMQVGIMELANAGDLKQFAQKNPDSNQLYNLLQQVLLGLAFLHSKGVIHRDLKPQNILLIKENGKLTAKISDFGISKSMDANTDSASLTIGTIEYMAPEQFNPGKYGINGKISTNVDLWSFGIMVHELITNSTPFGQRSGSITAEQIMSSILTADLPKEIDNIKEPYQTVIKKCLIADAKQRTKTATEILNYLEVNHEKENLERPEVATHIIPLSAITSKGTNEDFETKVLDATKVKMPEIIEPPSSSPEEIVNPGTNKKLTKNKLIIGIFASVFIVFAIVFGFKFYKSSNPTENNFYSTIEKKLDNKEYAAILNALKDSVDLRSQTISSSAIKYYTTALLASGDTTKAIPYISKSVELGINEHAYTLGELYFKGSKGSNVKQSYKEAKQYFIASLNDARSETMLGNIYFMGLGGEHNYEKALVYYSSAARRGNAIAMYSLGLAYLNGAGVEKNSLEAKKWFEKAIAKDDNGDVTSLAEKKLIEVKKDDFKQLLIGKWEVGDGVNAKGELVKMNSPFITFSANGDCKIVLKNGSVIPTKKWSVNDSVLNTGKWFAKIIYIDNKTMKTSDIKGGTNVNGIDNWKKIERERINQAIIKSVEFIYDYEEIFSKTQEQELEELIRKFAEERKVEIVILSIDDSIAESVNFENLIYGIANDWGVGNKEVNNGIVIGISKKLGKIRILNGTGIEAKLSDEETKKIIDNLIIPEYKYGNLFEGTKKGLLAIMEKIR